MTDPRPAVLERRLAAVQRIIAVTGGKGGIGKSSVAAAFALALTADKLRVGLLDLDLGGPSAHLILGSSDPRPTEEDGLVPAMVAGVRLLSIASFIGDEAAPIRGSEVADVLLELLAVTQWGNLDVLVVDLPPGLGDTFLDILAFVPRAEVVVVTTPSPLACVAAGRTLTLLCRLRANCVGIVENMSPHDSGTALTTQIERGVPTLGSIGRDEAWEAAIGHVELLARTRFVEQAGVIARLILSGPVLAFRQERTSQHAFRGEASVGPRWGDRR